MELDFSRLNELALRDFETAEAPALPPPKEPERERVALTERPITALEFHVLGWEELTDSQLEALKPLPFVLRSFIEAKLIMMAETQRRTLTIPQIPATTEEALEVWKKYFPQDVASYQEAMSTPAYIPET